MKSKNRKYKSRIRSIQLTGFVMFLLVLFVSVSLFWRGLFDVNAQQLKEYRYCQPDIILPMRGQILDRNGKILAQSREAYTLHCNPQEMDNPELFINQIAPIVNFDEQIALSDLKKAISNTERKDAEIFKKMNESQMERIKKLVKNSSICNYNFVIDQKREYPKRYLAASLIGWVGDDKTGLSGLEYSYNNILAGIPGRKVYNRSFSGNKVPGSEEIIQPPIQGDTIVLAIDEKLQSKVESILEMHVERWNAKGGTVIIMEPKTGEILAMASNPSFDLNNGGEFILDSDFSNKAVSMNYEPGSIFKSITAASALELGVVSPEDEFECEGQIWVENKQIQCMFPHGIQKMTDYMRNSCNVALAQVGMKMGIRLLDFVEKFNFGSLYPLNLLGQESGILPSRDYYSDLEAANVSFGTSISVTPIQIISAYAAIINGGDLMKPILIKEIRDSNGKIVNSFKPEILKKIISTETSKEMVSILQNVVQNKYGCSNAKIKGMPVGGKTGTAKKVTNGQYQNDKIICSFIGFFPADEPEYLILVSIDEPHPYGDAYGSTVAAPAFKDISEWIIRIGQNNVSN
ncbi:MAG: penicillin-binding protein 2 [Caldisericia bacterium]|nr:penicillin-binding protein 2 [Caldisericia bacterium]